MFIQYAGIQLPSLIYDETIGADGTEAPTISAFMREKRISAIPSIVAYKEIGKLNSFPVINFS